MGRTALLLTVSFLVSHPLTGQDTLRVTADNRPIWSSPIELVEELRLGALEGAEHEVFGRIVGVVGLEDGTTFVADGQGPIIYRYGPAGEYLGSVGREGEGPGEYQRINELVAFPGNRVAMQDARSLKAIIYRSDGTLDSDFRVEAGLNSVDPTFHADEHGRVYAKTMDLTSFTPSPTGGVVEDVEYLWIRIDPQEGVTDTIRPPSEDPVGPEYTMITPDGARHPYTIETESTISPAGYIVWGRNDEYAFYRELRDGRVVQVSRRGERPRVTAEEREQFERISEYFEQRGDVTYPPIPEVKPFFRTLRADPAGRIWVERYTTSYNYEYGPEEREERGDRPLIEWREVQVYDVFEPEGRFLGTVELPRRTQLKFVLGDRLWAVQLGEYDEPYVVRYRIRQGG